MKFNVWYDEELKGKDINLVMRGGGAAHSGTIVGTWDSCKWLIIDDRWSKLHYFKIEDIQSFWFKEDEEK